MLARHGVERLPGLHCYDLVAGADEIAPLSSRGPGTYFLTDFLVRSFDRAVVAELGLDRHPEPRATTSATTGASCGWPSARAELLAEAERAAGVLGLPLEVRPTGDDRLERALAELVGA